MERDRQGGREGGDGGGGGGMERKTGFSPVIMFAEHCCDCQVALCFVR